MPEVPEPARPRTGMQSAAEEPERTEQRILVGVDPLLELGRLLFGQATVLHGFVDAVLQCLLQRVRQLRGLDAELGRRVVDDRLALVIRREHPGRSDRAGRAEPGDEERDAGGAGRDGRLLPSRHARHETTNA